MRAGLALHHLLEAGHGPGLLLLPRHAALLDRGLAQPVLHLLVHLQLRRDLQVLQLGLKVRVAGSEMKM